MEQKKKQELAHQDQPVKRKGGTCRGCGIYIEWIKTKAGKDMPVDPEGATIITEDGEVKKGFIPHWVTCPKADNFRKK